MGTTTPYVVTDNAGARWFVMDAPQLRVPLDWDPNSGFFLAACPAGMVLNAPVFLKGANGQAPAIGAFNVTELAWNDSTPASGSAVLISDGDGVNPPVYALNVTQHAGQPGADGTAVLNPAAYGTPQPGLIVVVGADSASFVYQSQLCGDEYWPASYSNAVSGLSINTLCPIPVPPQLFAWRPEVVAQTIVSSTGSPVTVDLVARLNDASDGNIVGQGFGVPSTLDKLILTSGPPAGSSGSFNMIPAGVEAMIYINTELQSGSAGYTTSATTTTAKVRVQPVLSASIP